MSTDFNSAITTIKNSENKLNLSTGKVSNFAYDEQAFTNDDVAGTASYNYTNHNNIPLGTAEVLQLAEDVINKGVRSQASSITRMAINHFFGRCAYNINKLAMHLQSLLVNFISFLKEGDNAWSPTVEYKVGDIVYFSTTLNYEPCKRTFQCIVDCPDVNYPPVYTDGSLINTTYWKEISGTFASVTIGSSNAGNTNVATINGSLTVNGNITQSGTTYVTHAEQIYTKKDNIITREDATSGLASNAYSGIKVTNYDGEDTNGILAFRSDGTAVVGDEAGDPAVTSLQPLLTREETNLMTGGAPLIWNAVTKKAYTGSWGSAGAEIIASTVTTSPIPISTVPTNGAPIQMINMAGIMGTDGTTGLSLSYTQGGVTTTVPVKVPRQGQLVNLCAKEVSSGTFKYMDAYTTLDLVYMADADGGGNPAFVVFGNPVVLSASASNSSYTVYADGWIEQWLINQTSLGSSSYYITLPIAHSDTNYIAMICGASVSSGGYGGYDCRGYYSAIAYSKTQAQVKTFQYGDTDSNQGLSGKHYSLITKGY